MCTVGTRPLSSGVSVCGENSANRQRVATISVVRRGVNEQTGWRMRRSRSIGHYERNRDARGRFVARAGSHGSVISPRTRSQPGQTRSPEEVGARGTQEEVDETQEEAPPLSVREAYQISFSEEETDFRRRSSVLSGLLRAVNKRGSVAAGQRRQLRQQPAAAMAAQIKF